jgi:hypothetical protein
MSGCISTLLRAEHCAADVVVWPTTHSSTACARHVHKVHLGWREKDKVIFTYHGVMAIA